MRRLRLRASAGALVASVLALGGCAGAPARVAPVEWRWPAPELMPRDLDFVVRIDAQALAKSGFASSLPALARSYEGTPSAVRATLSQLERAKVIHVGGRIMTDGLHGDGVVVVEQVEATSVAAPGAPFREMGARGAARWFEHRDATARDESVLEVVLPSAFVLATPSEADAVLRVLDAGPDRERIEVPARGVVSFAGRVPRGLARDAWPVLLRATGEGLLRYEGALELSLAPSTELTVELELSYSSSSAAEAAASELRAIAERVLAPASPLRANEWRVAAQSLEVVQAESALRVGFRVPFALLRSVH